MDFITTLLIAIGLAMDSFAVSLAIGTTTLCRDSRTCLRIALHFAVFQALMPVLGWLAGTFIARYIQDYDHWVAFGLLAYIGIRMLISGLGHSNDKMMVNPRDELTILVLSLATSIDALAVGLSLAMLDVEILQPVLIIGLVTMILSIIGLQVGDRLGLQFGKIMRVAGGVILISIGIRILITHLIEL